MNSGKALLGVFAGIAAGTVLGILFAPEKGSNTRKNIVKKSDDLAHALNHKIDQKFDELLTAVTGNTKKVRLKNEEAAPGKSQFVD